MTRPLRLEYPGAFWHGTARGNEKQAIFRDDEDRWAFLTILGRVTKRFNWLVHALVLMGNHYHVAVETPERTLAKGMRHLNGVYAQRFNRRHKRCGHLFQGRYDARLIQDPVYLIEVARYVVLNPVRAGIVALPGQWPWSSFRATAGLESPPEWLETDLLLSHFGGDPQDSRASYVDFVMDGIGRELDIAGLLVETPVIGSARFRAQTQSRINEQERSREHPRSQRHVSRPTSTRVTREVLRVFQVTQTDLHSRTCREPRMALALLCHDDCLMPHREVGALIGVGASGVSYLLGRGRRRLEDDDGFRQRVALLRRLARRTDN